MLIKIQWIWLMALSLHLCALNSSAGTGNSRLRLIVETDAGGDPDDEQSLVRFLLYVNEWDVEGIIANRAAARDGENRNRERTGPGIVRRLVRAYGDCYTNLVEHDQRYPKPEFLLERTVPGYNEVDDGVKLLIAAVDREDPRPVWFLNWGTDLGAAVSCLKRALDRVRSERGEAGYAKFKARIRLSSDNQFEPHTSDTAPPFALWIDTFRPPLEGKRWYHRFSAITATAGGFDLQRDVLRGHGPLGALYPTNTTHWQKEGDSMTFLYLIPTGMNDPGQPTWGSWAGRYGHNEHFGSSNYFWANQTDVWNGTTNRDNTLRRWAADFQNDFRARLDWCVKPFVAANHPPAPALNGTSGKEIAHVKAAPGATISFSGSGSRDPDKNSLVYEWFVYREAGSYAGRIDLTGTNTVTTSLQIPENAAGSQIHLILRVTDNGVPPLSSYRRAVIDVEARRARNQ